MHLAGFTTEQLEKEIARRKDPGPPKPVMLENPDLTPLKKICQEYIDLLADPNPAGLSEADDFVHYIFEIALQTFFGEDVFKSYINKKVR